MKKLLPLFFLFLTSIVSAQIDVNPAGAPESAFTPQELIENVLLTNCATVNWIGEKTFTSGSNTNFGYFTDNGSAFPLSSGIVLSTGWINFLEGTNNSPQTINTVLNQVGDNDLQTLCDTNFPGVDVPTFDAVCFEFEITPDLNAISFSYIFASEEYDDFDPMMPDSSSECFTNTNQGLQDTFAILVSGPGIVPDPEFAGNPAATQWNNIAKVPASTQPVSVGTIHGNPTCTLNPNANNGLYNSIPIGTGDITLNGMTDILTASTSVTAGQTYRVKIVIGDRGDFQSDSAVFLLGSTIGLNVDLGPDLSIANGTAICGASHVLDAGPGGSTYTWTGPGGFSANTQTVNVTQDGVYTVDVSVGGCTESDSILVEFVQTPGAGRVDQSLSVCDDNFGAIDDEIGLFDLTIFSPVILAHPSNTGVNPADLNIIYYETEADAIANTNPIADPANYVNLNNNPQQIFFRVENINSPNCLSPYVSADHNFQVRVLSTPQISPVTDISVCDIDIDGSVTFDLTPQVNEAIGALNPADVVVDFYDSEADLLANVNPYPTTSATVTANPQTIWVRLSNSSSFGCFTYTSFEVTILDAPQIQALNDYEICDNDSVGNNTDGFVVFDLTTYNATVVNGQATVFSPTYHTTQADADAGTNPIANPATFANTTANMQTVFVRLEDSVNGCVNTAPLNLVVVPVPVLNNFTLIQCEVDAVIDGLTLFTLSEANTSLITSGVAADYIFSYHLTQAEADSFSNPLPNNYNNTSPNQIVFARVQENATGCYNVTQVTLTAVNNPVPPAELNLCDLNGDGVETFVLSNANAQITPSVPPGSTIVYYVSEFDAQQEQNSLPNMYTSISASQVIYYRVEDSGDCYGIGTLTLNANPLPIDNPSVTPYSLCSDDGTTAIFNLSSKDAEILNGQTGMTVTYYASQADAIADVNPHPMVYSNVTNPETVFFRIENNTTNCFSAGSSFQLIVNQNPPVVTPTPLRVCDVVTLGDGIEQFDLTVKNTEISGGNTNFAVTYYPTQADADNETNEILGLYTNSSNPETLFVRVEDVNTACYSTTTLEIRVDPLPTAVTPTDLYACDIDNNGIVSDFDLTSKDLEITNSNPNLSVTYHETATDAEQNLNALSSPYSNINFPFLQPIYARVVDANTQCFVVVTFNLVTVDSPQLDINVTPLALCDSDQDGMAVFDLTSKTTEILNGQPATMPVTFYETQANADAGINPIVNPNAYSNTTNPQTIFFRIENQDDGDPLTPTCFVVGSFDLIVNLPPVLQSPVPSIEVCDDDFYVPVTVTPTFVFDLTQNEDFILNGLSGLNFTYFDDDTNTLITDPTAWENITNADTVRVEVSDNNGCTSIVFFDVRVLPNPTPMPPSQTPDLEVCEGDGDETSVFDLTVNEAIITGGDPDVTVSYHETYDDANTDPPTTGIATPTSYTNTSNPQTIFVRVTNVNTGCYTITSFNLAVPIPSFDLGDDQIVCLDENGNTTGALPVLDTGLPNDGTYAFSWTLDGNAYPGNGPSITANAPGTYMVTVTDQSNPQCFTTDTVVVDTSTAPLSLTLEVTTEFFTTDDHTIVATVTGGGNYQYSLDNGPYQDSNVFTNVSVGAHTVTVIDINGCGQVSETVAVIGYKKFFTPNGDGYNETWQIVGVEALPSAEIFIFDRYGKLLKQLSPLGEGWDGTFKGNAMPSTDYWFKILYTQNGESKEFGAHFSLKR